MLVLQTMFNDKMDRRLGLPTAALIRFAIGLGGLAVLMSHFPMLATSHHSLLNVTGEHSGCQQLVSKQQLVLRGPGKR